MGEPIQKAYGAMDRRETLFYFDPFKVVIVGLDVEAGGSVLEDSHRVALGVDEDMVQSFMAMGSVTPITVRKNGKKPDGSPNVECVVGRGRLAALREAWIRLRRAGVAEADLPPIMAISSRGATEADLLAIMLVENFQRREETPLSGARKAAKLYKLVRDKKLVANRCHVSVQTLDAWLSLLELSPGAQRHIERGEVAAHVALDLLKGVPVEQQDARLDPLIAEGKARGLAAQSEVIKNKQGKPTPRAADGEPEEAPALPRRRAVRRFRAALKESPRSQVFSLSQVEGLIDFLIDGKPMRGPLRALWGKVEKVKS